MRAPLGHGFADFSDLDTLAGRIDSNLRRRPSGGPIRLFLAEFTLPTDHANHEYDEPPNGPNGAPGDEVNRGLLEWDGDRKPSYRAFRRGMNYYTML